MTHIARGEIRARPDMAAVDVKRSFAISTADIAVGGNRLSRRAAPPRGASTGWRRICPSARRRSRR